MIGYMAESDGEQVDNAGKVGSDDAVKGYFIGKRGGLAHRWILAFIRQRRAVDDGMGDSGNVFAVPVRIFAVVNVDFQGVAAAVGNEQEVSLFGKMSIRDNVVFVMTAADILPRQM